MSQRSINTNKISIHGNETNRSRFDESQSQKLVKQLDKPDKLDHNLSPLHGNETNRSRFDEK